MELTLKRIPKLLLAQVHTRNTLAHKIIAMLPPLDLDRPIFILGLPRSGTSIFCTLFGTNRNVAHWSEAPVVWDPRWRAFDNEHRWLADRATPQALRRINNNFAYYTKWKGCRRFVNKHPRNALRVPFLRAGWPDAYLILVQRDARAVANSLLEITRREKRRHKLPLGGFARPEGWRAIDAIADDMEKFARMTAAIHRTLTDDIARHADPARLFEVRYEDFAADCRGVLRRAFAFCDVPVDDRALANRVSEKLENRNFKWAKSRTEAEIRTMHRVLAPVLIESGYEKDDAWLEQALAAKGNAR